MQREIISDLLGDVVKTTRQKRKITQVRLAECLSISLRHLKAIENGYKKPSYDLLVRMIRELDIQADMVFRPESDKK